MTYGPASQMSTGGPGMTTAKLYRRCVRWGLVTGAVAGSATGVAIGLHGLDLDLALGLAVWGFVTGLVFSVVPTVIASSLVTAVVRHRHPHPASAEAVERDLGALFCIIVLVLDVMFLVGVFVHGDGFRTVAPSLPVLAVANVTVAAVLWRARTSIARNWSDG